MYDINGWLYGRGVRDHASVKRRKGSPLRRVINTAHVTFNHRVARDSHRLRGGDDLDLVCDVTTITERETRSNMVSDYQYYTTIIR